MIAVADGDAGPNAAAATAAPAAGLPACATLTPSSAQSLHHG